MTRTMGSVPEGRSSTRPVSPRVASAAATASAMTLFGGKRVVVDAAHVHEHLRVHGHDGRELGERLARARHLGDEVQAREHAVAGRRELRS